MPFVDSSLQVQEAVRGQLKSVDRLHVACEQ